MSVSAAISVSPPTMWLRRSVARRTRPPVRNGDAGGTLKRFNQPGQRNPCWWSVVGRLVSSARAHWHCAATRRPLPTRAQVLAAVSRSKARLPGLSNWARVRDYRSGQLDQLAGAEVYLNSSMDADLVEEFGSDHVVLATGSHWRRDGKGRRNTNNPCPALMAFRSSPRTTC